MRLVGRILLAGAVLAIVLVLVGAAAAGFLIFTETGQQIARDRTQATIARVLGPSFRSELGEQTIELRRDGTLAVGWSDVTVTHADDPNSPTIFDHVGFALRLMPLLSGGVEFARLEIEGARVELGAFLAGQTPNVPLRERSFSRMADGAVLALERQLATLSALKFDTVAFRDIQIDGLPGLDDSAGGNHIDFAELRRSGNGTLDLSTSLQIGRVGMALSGNAGFDSRGELERMSLRSSPVDLGAIVPPGPMDEPDDERRFATDADLSVTFTVERPAASGRLASQLALTLGPGALQVGRNRTRIEEAQLRLRHAEGEDRLEILPSPMRFAEVSFDLGGQLGVELDEDDGETISFLAETTDLVSHVGQSTPPREDDERLETPLAAKVVAQGLLRPAAGIVRLDRLVVDAGGGRLSGNGRLDLSDDAALSSFQLEGGGIGADAVKAFWPFNIAGRPRQWVLDHVGDRGLARSFDVRLSVRRDRFADAFGRGGRARDDELQIDAAIEDADLRTVGSLPAIYNANGSLRLRGGQTVISLQDSMVEGLPAVALGASTLTFSRPSEGNPRDTLLDISIGAAGSVPELLAIADADPIRALRSLDIIPGDASGTASVEAGVSLRLGAGIAPADQLLDWQVRADVVDASLAKPIEGRRFANLTGRLSVDRGAAEAQLSGLMDDIPAEIDLTLPIGASPSVERAVSIDLEVSAAKALQIVPALTGSLEGPIDVQLRQDANGLRAELDLVRTSLQIPAVAWTKGRGVPARLSVDVAQAGEEIRLSNLVLEGSGFSAAGEALIDGRGLRSASLTRVALNPGDDVSLTMTRSNNGFSAQIQGEQFDARPLLQQLRAEAGRSRPSNDSGMTFDIAATIDRVRGFDDSVMEGVSVNYASFNGRVAALSLTGRAGGGVSRADLSPRGDLQSIRISTEDLGAFVGFSGLYPNIEGGSAVLQLTGTAEGRYSGELDVRNFEIVDEPRLERIVGSQPANGQASLSQALGQDLRTSRAFFDQASASLGYSDGRLQVANGILRGPVFGSSFEGTLYDSQSRIDIAGSFMPAYTVNRVFGAIPLVGQILGNGNEGGLLGITYRLSGAFTSPSLTINPISLIAPGVFRQIFEY